MIKPLSVDETCELRALAERLLAHIRTYNYRDFEASYPRFSELLERWRSVRDPHGVQ